MLNGNRIAFIAMILCLLSASALTLPGGCKRKEEKKQEHKDEAKYIAFNTQGEWNPISLDGAPSPTGFFICVWTGSHMIVWGGSDGGGLYDPVSDYWEPMNSSEMPVIHSGTGVWAFDRFYIFGIGNSASYDPASHTWETLEDPLGIADKTKDQALLCDNAILLTYRPCNTQGFNACIYYPGNDSWTDVLIPRSNIGGYSILWTGSEVITWGGQYRSPPAINDIKSCDTGYISNLQTGEWRYTTNDGAPSARSGHSAIWTGSRMIIWGGYYYHAIKCGANEMDIVSYVLYDGGSYDPETDTWEPVSRWLAPGPMSGHFACWTGDAMIILGGNTGGIYYPDEDRWTITSSVNAPGGITAYNAVWTGEKVIVFGGTPETSGIFTP
ncbi:MAG: hypothetical protein E3J72_22690 [Planctomycetota bacterium]|nr:MAG: hypothetical protein E3J72_22690 [Planctomycetota bacterium]